MDYVIYDLNLLQQTTSPQLMGQVLAFYHNLVTSEGDYNSYFYTLNTLLVGMFKGDYTTLI